MRCPNCNNNLYSNVDEVKNKLYLHCRVCLKDYDREGKKLKERIKNVESKKPVDSKSKRINRHPDEKLQLPSSDRTIKDSTLSKL